MTWKELKERIEQMSSEDQDTKVIVWDEFPKEVIELCCHDENVYSDGIDALSEEYIKKYPNWAYKLVLKEGEYYLGL